MKRYISLFITSIFLFSLIVLPTFAAESELLDYNDFIVDQEFDGTNDNVVVKFPSSLATLDFYRMSPSPEIRLDQVDSSSYSWSITSGNTYRFYGYPMGYSNSSSNNRLDLSNIPNGTNIHFDVTFHWGVSEAIVNTPYYSCIVFYYGDNGSLLSQTFWEGKGPGEGAPYDEDTWSFDLTIDKPIGAKSLLFYAQLSHLECTQSGDITVSLDNFSMDFSVSALYRLQEQSGKNNALLNDIKDTLTDQGDTIEEFVSEQEETNTKLDNIINGEVEASKPPYSSMVEDLSDLESGVMDNIDENIGFIDDSFDTAFDAFVSYNQSILGAAFIFNSFADIGFFGSVLYVSLSLGVVASIFGVAASVLSKSGSGKSKGGKK